jgi:hypothetical protein
MDDVLTKMAMASLLGGGLSSTKPLTADEFKTMHGKITDLKVGDELRYLGAGGYKVPSKGDTVIVASLDIPPMQQDSGASIRRKDFSAFFKDSDGDLIELAFDSRHFERV